MFVELSIIDGIDEIMAQIIQIEQIIDDNNNKQTIKKQLSIVENKLSNIRTKCSKTGMDSVCNSINDLKSNLDKLSKEIKDNKEECSLSLLVELKKLEQDAIVQHQKLEVYFFCVCLRMPAGCNY